MTPKNSLSERAQKIVAEFEDMFGRLSATERDWLTRRIAQDAKTWADEENDRLIAESERLNSVINDYADAIADQGSQP